MENFNFEKRLMTVEERKTLENGQFDNWSIAKYAFVIWLVILCISCMVRGELPTKNDGVFVLALIPITIVAFMYFHYKNGQIRLDLEVGETFMATATMRHFMLNEGDDVNLMYTSDLQKHELMFYLDAYTRIKLKSFKQPIQYAESHRSILEKSFKNGQMYRLSFVLKSEYLLSIEEIY
jgi:hypothetical protein